MQRRWCFIERLRKRFQKLSTSLYNSGDNVGRMLTEVRERTSERVASMSDTGLTYRVGSQAETDACLRELILYVCDKCMDMPRFGAIKLNKILYACDFLAFRRFGNPITGAAYMRQNKGPVPRRFLPVREKMIKKNELHVKQMDIVGFEHPEERHIALREAKIDEYFTASEISLVDEVIEKLWEFTGEQVSDMSHGKAWEAAKNGDAIPYETAYLSDHTINQTEIEWAHRLNKKYGWELDCA